MSSERCFASSYDERMVTAESPLCGRNGGSGKGLAGRRRRNRAGYCGEGLMPEGDILRAARTLHRVLAGQKVTG